MRHPFRTNRQRAQRLPEFPCALQGSRGGLLETYKLDQTGGVANGKPADLTGNDDRERLSLREAIHTSLRLLLERPKQLVTDIPS